MKTARRYTRSGVWNQWKAQEEATALAEEFATSAAALAWLGQVAGWDRPVQPKLLLRKAKRVSHPDMGGDAAVFARVVRAEAFLRRKGMLR